MIDDKPPLDELVHHGVKGMRWGVRREQSSSSGGAFRRQAMRKTNEAINLHKSALTNKGTVGKAALLDKYTWGRNGRFEGYHNKRISELERSKEHIARGKLVARTLLLGPKYSTK